MHAGPGGDQQFAEAELIATSSFNCPAVDIDPTHARSQMDLEYRDPDKTNDHGSKFSFGPDP